MKFVSKVFLLASVLTFVSLTALQAFAEPTNGNLQSLRVLSTDARATLEVGLKEFTPTTLPHEAKDLRKQIVRLRDVLDVFSHNFMQQKDLWEQVREDLDQGYEIVGEYKDLYDSQIDPQTSDSQPNSAPPVYPDLKRLEKRRARVLKWRAEYFAEDGLRDALKDLLESAVPLEIAGVESDKVFSRFFWGGVKATPNEHYTAAANALVLVRAQGRVALKESEDFLEIKNLSKLENEEKFHDHRKRLRTLAKVCSIADALEPEACPQADVDALNSFVSQLGEVEDVIVAARLKKEDGKDKKADELFELAEKKFKSLKLEIAAKDLYRPVVNLVH